jgi:hypothetical protein
MPVSCSRITDASADSGIPPPRHGEHGAHQIGQLTSFLTVLYANPLQMTINIHYIYILEQKKQGPCQLIQSSCKLVDLHTIFRTRGILFKWETQRVGINPIVSYFKWLRSTPYCSTHT